MDLRSLKPFQKQNGRAFKSLMNISDNPTSSFDQAKFDAWIERHKKNILIHYTTADEPDLEEFSEHKHLFFSYFISRPKSNMAARAPKQWQLSKNETITSYESWRQNLMCILSLDNNFVPFLEATWQKKTASNLHRGLVDEGETIPEARRLTAVHKKLT